MIKPTPHTAFDYRSKNYSHEMNWILDERFINCFALPAYKNEKLLDAGAGNGIISRKCHELGWNVTAVDINQSMMAAIPTEIKISLQSIEELTFSDNTFFVTVCRQVLQYTNIERALSSMYRVTNKELRLGHIKFISYKDNPFWENFFLIGNPYRKHIFYKEENFISNAISLLKLPVSNITNEEFEFEDIIVSRRKYDNSTYEKLYELFKTQNQDFIKRNKVRFLENGDIYCTRIWSFSVLKILAE